MCSRIAASQPFWGGFCHRFNWTVSRSLISRMAFKTNRCGFSPLRCCLTSSLFIRLLSVYVPIVVPPFLPSMLTTSRSFGLAMVCPVDPALHRIKGMDGGCPTLQNKVMATINWSVYLLCCKYFYPCVTISPLSMSTGQFGVVLTEDTIVLSLE